MKITSLIRWQYRVLAILLGMAILIFSALTAWWGWHNQKTWDWTANHRNSLNLETRKLLSRIKTPIKLIAFVSNSGILHRRIRREISLYQTIDPSMTLRFVNPNLHPNLAQHYRIEHDGVLIIQMEKSFRKINSLSQQAIFNALLHLLRGRKNWIVFLTGQGESTPTVTTNNGLSDFAKALLRNGYRWITLNLSRISQVPDNTRVLIVAGPTKNFSEAEQTLIRHYLQHGGALLWMEHSKIKETPKFLKNRYNIRFLNGVLINENRHVEAILGLSSPKLIPVIKYARVPLTKSLKYQTIFPFVHAIRQPSGNISWSETPLLVTSHFIWRLPPVSTRAQTQFSSSNSIQSGPFVIGETLSQRNGHGRIVVIGTNEFLWNSFLGQGQNLDLGLDIVSWLSHQDNLVQIHQASSQDIRLGLPHNLAYFLAGLFLAGLPLIYLTLASWLFWRIKRR